MTTRTIEHSFFTESDVRWIIETVDFSDKRHPPVVYADVAIAVLRAGLVLSVPRFEMQSIFLFIIFSSHFKCKD